MRISNVEVKLSASDLNGIIKELAPDANITITEIQDDGIHGQLKVFMWFIDFVAKPGSNAETEEVSVEIAARKLVPIPSAIVERSLQEAMKDAPQGIEVIRQQLKVHVPSILSSFGINLRVRDFRCRNGLLSLAIDHVNLPMLSALLKRTDEAASKEGGKSFFKGLMR